MGSTLARGLQASLSSRSGRTLPSMLQKFSAASSSWLKAWRRSWWTRWETWIPMMFHFTRISGKPSQGSTCSQRVWGKFTEGNAPRSHPHQQCPSMCLRGSSGVTLCWRHPGTTWAGWSLSLGSKLQKSKEKMRWNMQVLQQHVTGTWRGVDTTCNFFLTQVNPGLWCRQDYSS